MTQIQQTPNGPQRNRIRIALAALTGVLAGASRAITDWLLHHLDT
ncbi:hypothetical protein GCM10010112_72940 [Actinoplanes lobatus]|uniref:Uncharacterized protein n=1 Tax=Actinoplanes lobatus TaxID=113568 RepID=A0A7W7HRA8_9ACTN|nr:hypothetical protein [Actinoplanes lobatus]MBB4755187.1 hypothetical protein [Actinoplanes lobatus]GGN88967.1 hypothetical protein GCM10010112_72940 [Actinoplanes lobatus]GIE43392.1 hypothetical protein Alo02nite_62900 [Actinoplanes lobatus]